MRFPLCLNNLKFESYCNGNTWTNKADREKGKKKKKRVCARKRFSCVHIVRKYKPIPIEFERRIHGNVEKYACGVTPVASCEVFVYFYYIFFRNTLLGKRFLWLFLLFFFFLAYVMNTPLSVLTQGSVSGRVPDPPENHDVLLFIIVH